MVILNIPLYFPVLPDLSSVSFCNAALAYTACHTGT